LAATEFFDPLFGERDDWMVRVVMLFKAERLAVEGAIDLLLLVCEPREFGLAFVVVGFSGTCEFLSE